MTGSRTRLVGAGWTAILAALGAVLLAACGEDGEESRAMGKPMAIEKVEKPTSSVLGAAPVIERVTLRPERPRPGERIVAEVASSDPDGDAVSLEYEWRVDGRRVAIQGAAFQGEPLKKGSLVQVRVVARDGHNRSAPAEASVRVGNRPPTLLGVVLEPLDEVRAGQDVAATPRSTDPDGDPVEYRFTWKVNGEWIDESGSVLAGSHFERGDEIELTVVATDGQDESEPLRSAKIPVANSPPRITSRPQGFDEEGVLRYRIQADDADGDRSFRYRLVEAPKGMTLDVVDGVLSWIPGDDQGGVHPVTIEVADIHGGRSTQSFQVTVAFEEGSTPPAATP